MEIKFLVDEDFVNYKKPSMFIGFPYCTLKCNKDCGQEVCQNKALLSEPNIEIEVEEIIELGKDIINVKTGKIISIEKHPNADKLSVTQVDAGQHGILQIITAATNIFEGAIALKQKAMWFETKEEFLEKAGEVLEEGDVILIKASHFMDFPKIVEALK
jgi:methylmalonyl-CoA mutase cobalamin-binding subunit